MRLKIAENISSRLKRAHPQARALVNIPLKRKNLNLTSSNGINQEKIHKLLKYVDSNLGLMKSSFPFWGSTFYEQIPKAKKT